MKFANLVYVMELFSLSVVCCLYRLRRQQSQTFLHNVCRRTNVDRLITRWLAQRNEKDGTLSFTEQTADRFRPLGSRVQRTVQLQHNPAIWHKFPKNVTGVSLFFCREGQEGCGEFNVFFEKLWDLNVPKILERQPSTILINWLCRSSVQFVWCCSPCAIN
jgi:hypothetical protein